MTIESEVFINIFLRATYSIILLFNAGVLFYLTRKFQNVELKCFLRKIYIWFFLLGSARMAAIILAFFTPLGDAIIPLIISIFFWIFVLIQLIKLLIKAKQNPVIIEKFSNIFEEFSDLLAKNIQKTDNVYNKLKKL